MIKSRFILLMHTVFIAFCAINAQTTNFNSFKPGGEWLANDGKHIDCHAGNIVYNESLKTFFWFGEHRGSPRGVGCYSSKDLYNWVNEGVVLKASAEIAVLERPKVVYNSTTHKYVMWFHYDNSSYSLAHLGVAASDSIRGPYTLINHLQPNGHDSRDMGMYADDDGKVYIIYSTSMNSTMRIVELSSDYLNVTTNDVDIQTHCEGPGMLKINNTYYLITSLCSGWAPNKATYYTAKSVMGPYTSKGDPCIGDSNHTTFNAQSCSVFKVPGFTNGFMFLGDRWNGGGYASSQYVFLPLVITQTGAMELRYYSSWDLGVFTPVSLINQRNNRFINSISTVNQQPFNNTVYDILGRGYGNTSTMQNRKPTIIINNKVDKKSLSSDFLYNNILTK